MKARICYPFVGDSIGGAHISSLILIEGIRKRGYDPVVVLHREGPLSRHLKERAIPFELQPLRRFAGEKASLSSIASGTLEAVAPLRTFLLKNRIDIVHANDLRMNLTWLAPARVTGARMVWHQRTLPNSRSMIWRALPWMTSAVIPISKAVAEAMQLPPDSVIYNPFDMDRDPTSREDRRNALCSELGIRQDSLIIGNVGRLVRYKRPDLCIEVLALLSKSLARTSHCVFVGRGSDDEEGKLKQQAKALGVEENLHFLGFRYPVEPDLKAFDVLMAPSETEGFGRVLVESMMVGTPVVASSIDAHREIIDTTGVGTLVPPGEAEAFAMAIADLASSPSKWQEVSTRSATGASAAYSTEQHLEKMCRLYGRLVQ